MGQPRPREKARFRIFETKPSGKWLPNSADPFGCSAADAMRIDASSTSFEAVNRIFMNEDLSAFAQADD